MYGKFTIDVLLFGHNFVNFVFLFSVINHFPKRSWHIPTPSWLFAQIKQTSEFIFVIFDHFIKNYLALGFWLNWNWQWKENQIIHLNSVSSKWLHVYEMIACCKWITTNILSCMNCLITILWNTHFLHSFFKNKLMMSFCESTI